MILILSVLGITDVKAQYKSEKDATIPLESFYIERKGPGVLRLLLSKVHFGLSTGYGRTGFNHELSGLGVIQNPDSLPKLFNPSSVNGGYSKWVNGVLQSPNTVQPGAFLVNSDTTSIGFKSRTFNIPLKATIHVEFDRYRLGGGYSIEYTHIGQFNPTNYADRINGFKADKSTIFMKHYFVMLGAMVYRYYEYALVVDANIGGYGLGKSFDKSQIKKGMYFNLGLSAEREFSEYFKVFIRPSYEFKGYKLSVPEAAQTINHKLNAFYINIGASYRLPELRRCFLKSCHAQLNHAHGDREYRSRRHAIYKKQNPHYGENYPTLIKYKGRNKKKLNPY